MSAFNHGSRSRSDAYSKVRFSNWMPFDPWRLEVRAMLSRYDHRLAENPHAPKIIQMSPSEGFRQPCNRVQVEAKLHILPDRYLKGLRAIFLLPGTRKQLKAWHSSRACHGMYSKACVFLFALPENDFSPFDLDTLPRYFLDDVLIHEIGHHNDPAVWTNTKKQCEDFAENFVLKIRHELSGRKVL